MNIPDAVVAAVVGLIGTLVGLWLGQRRWIAELQIKKRGAFDARRHEAYRELWSILENAHIALRTGRAEVAQVDELHRQINSFRLRNAVFLDGADSELSSRYFASVVDLSRVIAESGSRELTERFANTNWFTQQESEQVPRLVEANANVMKLRNRLLERIQFILLETGYAVSPTK